MYVPNSLKKSENSASKLRTRIVQPGVWTVVPIASMTSSSLRKTPCSIYQEKYIKQQLVKRRLHFADLQACHSHVVTMLIKQLLINHTAIQAQRLKRWPVYSSSSSRAAAAIDRFIVEHISSAISSSGSSSSDKQLLTIALDWIISHYFIT